ncbi:MAG: hypothetical protein O2827_02360 [Verrucomicrobia bacterium]|nr:hypothetical protein [Verrucomicrobiota bacterium]
MKNNTLITILTIITLTLLVIVILGIYKFFETDKKLKETINLHDESIKEVLKLKDLIQKDYLVKSISSDKQEYSGNLLSGFKLNVEYDVQIKLIDENLNYLVEFQNIPPHKDYENRLKNISVVFFDKDNFELLKIDLSKPSNQYVNSETYHSSGKIKLTTEIYELIDSCRFSIHSLSEEEYLSEEHTKNKNLEDWSFFLKNGMNMDEVFKLIGEPDSKSDKDNTEIFKYIKEGQMYELIFSNDKLLLDFNKIKSYKFSNDDDSSIKNKWNKIYEGQTLENVKLILGKPTFVYPGDYTYRYVYEYPNFDKKGIIIFRSKDNKVTSISKPGSF